MNWSENKLSNILLKILKSINLFDTDSVLQKTLNKF